ncbi:helix-turn-helix domain-containing protein [Nocardioides pyridinolyticus]
MPNSGTSKARLVITAITLEHRTVAEVVADYGVSKSWVYELMARYRAEGEDALEPRSRRPLTSPHATPTATVELILRLREQLLEAGLDAGAETIEWHLTHHHQITVSRATIHRILTGSGAVRPEPSKRPKSSYLRFEAAMPNETWLSDFTHYRLTNAMGDPGADVEIIAGVYVGRGRGHRVTPATTYRSDGAAVDRGLAARYRPECAVCALDLSTGAWSLGFDAGPTSARTWWTHRFEVPE